MGGCKHNQLKNKSYNEIQKLFDNEIRRVNTFIPMDSEVVKSKKETEESSKGTEDELESDKSKKAESSEEKAKGSRKKILGKKRAGKEQQQESSKRQRMEDDKETDEHEEVEVDDEAELKKHLVIVKDDDIAIDAIPLATKPLGIDREDLQTLWKLVKTKHGDTRPEDEHERVLWGDLKVMFEPDIKSDVWRNLQGYKVTIWKLYDSCGVHFVRSEYVCLNYEGFYTMNLEKDDILLCVTSLRSTSGTHKLQRAFSNDKRGSLVEVQLVTGETHNIDQLEMLLEAYFVGIDNTLNKLLSLMEYIDDTEDLINIKLCVIIILLTYNFWFSVLSDSNTSVNASEMRLHITGEGLVAEAREAGLALLKSLSNEGLKMQRCSGYTPSGLHDCVLTVQAFQLNKRGSSSKAIGEQYTHHMVAFWERLIGLDNNQKGCLKDEELLYRPYHMSGSIQVSISTLTPPGKVVALGATSNDGGIKDDTVDTQMRMREHVTSDMSLVEGSDINNDTNNDDMSFPAKVFGLVDVHKETQSSKTNGVTIDHDVTLNEGRDAKLPSDFSDMDMDDAGVATAESSKYHRLEKQAVCGHLLELLLRMAMLLNTSQDHLFLVPVLQQPYVENKNVIKFQKAGTYDVELVHVFKTQGVVIMEILCGRLAWGEGCKDNSESLGPFAERQYKEGNLNKFVFEGSDLKRKLPDHPEDHPSKNIRLSPSVANTGSNNLQAVCDEAWVPKADRVKISITNMRIDPTMTQKEETYQVILDIIKNTTFYKAFLATANVPEIYMQ
ncbi:uncharacterized mitochondrial protein-like protein [Tanacetum coccineum]